MCLSVAQLGLSFYTVSTQGTMPRGFGLGFSKSIYVITLIPHRDPYRTLSLYSPTSFQVVLGCVKRTTKTIPTSYGVHVDLQLSLEHACSLELCACSFGLHSITVDAALLT